MKILKFEEYINELWSKGLNRSKTGEQREEDKIHSNIDELKPIDIVSDLPFSIADDFLYINGDETISFIDYDTKYRNYVESKGWRLPNREDLSSLRLLSNPINQKISIDDDFDKTTNQKIVYITGIDSNKSVKFYNLDRFMWCDYMTNDEKTDFIGEIWTCKFKKIEYNQGGLKDKPQLIRLIKDKK